MLRFLLWGPSLSTTNLMEIHLFWIYSHAGKEGMMIQQVCNVSGGRVWLDIRCPVMNLALVKWHEFIIQFTRREAQK